MHRYEDRWETIKSEVLEKGPQNVRLLDTIDATHFVSRVLIGGNAFITLDKRVNSDFERSEVFYLICFTLLTHSCRVRRRVVMFACWWRRCQASKRRAVARCKSMLTSGRARMGLPQVCLPMPDRYVVCSFLPNSSCCCCQDVRAPTNFEEAAHLLKACLLMFLFSQPRSTGHQPPRRSEYHCSSCLADADRGD